MAAMIGLTATDTYMKLTADQAVARGLYAMFSFAAGYTLLAIKFNYCTHQV